MLPTLRNVNEAERDEHNLPMHEETLLWFNSQLFRMMSSAGLIRRGRYPVALALQLLY